VAGLIEQLGADDAARRARARDALVAALKSPDALLSRRAAEALAKAPEPALLPTWTKLLDSDDFMLRAAAAEALGRIGDRKAVATLLARLDDPRTEVRRKVIGALGMLGDPAAVAPLFERFVNRRGGNRDAKAVYADHAQYAADLDSLQQALIAIGEPAVDDLVRATEFGWGPLEEKARDALVKIGKPAIVPLLAALQGPDPMTKAGAARALGLLKPPEAVRPLIDVVATRGDYECTRAFEALIAYGEAARPTLRAAMKDARLSLMGRAAAAALLMNLGDASGRYIIESVIETREAVDANRMVKRMGMLRNRAFLPLLEKALRRPDAWQGVTHALARCGGKDAVPILMKALDHPNKGVQSGARSWLERLTR
jgi:HEAT repeat protein